MKYKFCSIRINVINYDVTFATSGVYNFATESHYWFLKACNYIELSKPSFTSSLSKNDEKIVNSAFPQRQQVSLPAFSSCYILNVKEKICEYSLVIYRQSIPCTISL